MLLPESANSGVILLLSIISISFGDHWRLFGRVLSIVVLVHLYRCSFYRCGARNIHRCILPDHIVASLFFAAFPLSQPFLFLFALQTSVCAFQFFFLSFSLSIGGQSFCVGQECRSQLLFRRIFFGLCASLAGAGRNSDQYEC